MVKVSRVGGVNTPVRVDQAKAALNDAIHVLAQLDEQLDEARTKLRAIRHLSEGRWPWLRKKSIRRILYPEAGG